MSDCFRYLSFLKTLFFSIAKLDPYPEFARPARIPLKEQLKQYIWESYTVWITEVGETIQNGVLRKKIEKKKKEKEKEKEKREKIYKEENKREKVSEIESI